MTRRNHLADIGKLPDYTSALDDIGKLPNYASVLDDLAKLPDYTSTLADIGKLPNYTSVLADIGELPNYTSALDDLAKLPDYTSALAEIGKLPNFTSALADIGKLPDYTSALTEIGKSADYTSLLAGIGKTNYTSVLSELAGRESAAIADDLSSQLAELVGAQVDVSSVLAEAVKQAGGFSKLETSGLLSRPIRSVARDVANASPTFSEFLQDVTDAGRPSVLADEDASAPAKAPMPAIYWLCLARDLGVLVLAILAVAQVESDGQVDLLPDPVEVWIALAVALSQVAAQLRSGPPR